jgi:hypothetical protein
MVGYLSPPTEAGDELSVGFDCGPWGNVVREEASGTLPGLLAASSMRQPAAGDLVEAVGEGRREGVGGRGSPWAGSAAAASMRAVS